MMKNVFRTLSVFLVLTLAVSLLLTSRPAEARKHRRHHRPSTSQTVKDAAIPPASGRAGGAGVAAGAAAGAAAGHVLSGRAQDGHAGDGHEQAAHVQAGNVPDGNAQGGHATACRTGAARCIAVAALPVQAQETLKLILAGGPFPYEKDGTVFGNYEGRLPASGAATTPSTPSARPMSAHGAHAGSLPAAGRGSTANSSIQTITTRPFAGSTTHDCSVQHSAPRGAATGCL